MLQFLRFALVGGAATLTHWGVVWAIESLVPSLHLNLSNLLGFLAAFPISYVGQRWFTFRSQAKHAAALPRFLGTQLLGLALNSAVVFALVWFSGVEHLGFVIVGTGVAMGAVFLISRLWVFSTD